MGGRRVAGVGAKIKVDSGSKLVGAKHVPCGTPLCPAGHLPLKGGDWRGASSRVTGALSDVAWVCCSTQW
jgi:hypothetical protein